MFKFLRVGWFPLHRPYSAFLTATVPSKLAPWKGERVKPRPISVSLKKKRGSKGFLPVLKCLILKRNFWASVYCLPHWFPLWFKSGPLGGTHFQNNGDSPWKNVHTHLIQLLPVFQILVINFVWLKLPSL